jgi:pyruvate/2-oxoacid:ferredoxin oxidoreductase beta subunit
MYKNLYSSFNGLNINKRWINSVYIDIYRYTRREREREKEREREREREREKE